MTKRVFTMRHQMKFGVASQDLNPLHVEALYARRLLFGGPVVHGMHLVLWAFNCWADARRKSVRLIELSADFRSPVILGKEVNLKKIRDSDGLTEIQLFVATRKVAIIIWHWEDIDTHEEWPPVVAADDILATPSDVSPAELHDKSGAIELPHLHQETLDLLPAVPKYFLWAQIQPILAMSTLVGMECPGLHSIFRSLSIKFDHSVSSESALNYQVRNFDERFKQVNIQVSSTSIAGEIDALFRPQPVTQPGIVELQKQVNSGEFSNQRALVIGGSRGLGEIAVKLLTAGGADVSFTYLRGEEDAMRIREEVAAAGFRCRDFKLDVLASDWTTLNNNHCRPTHLYYFATPFIFEGEKKVFSQELFQRFCDYYVGGFVNTIANVLDGVPDQKLTVFYPSSIAIDDMPLHMSEYVAAKSAGEAVCGFLQKSHKNIHIAIERLPRLATDQTVSILAVRNEDPIPILMSTLRRIHNL